MSTWGWVIEYSLVALLFLGCASVFVYLWGQDRWWRWLDHRDAKREVSANQSGVNPER